MGRIKNASTPLVISAERTKGHFHKLSVGKCCNMKVAVTVN